MGGLGEGASEPALRALCARQSVPTSRGVCLLRGAALVVVAVCLIEDAAWLVQTACLTRCGLRFVDDAKIFRCEQRNGASVGFRFRRVSVYLFLAHVSSF